MTESLDVLLASGHSYFLAHQYDQAIGPLSQFLGNRPAHFGALYLRGECLFRIGRHSEALADFHHAAKIKPLDVLNLYSMARAHLALGQRAEAVERARAAAEAGPRFGPAHELLARINLPGPYYTKVLAYIHQQLCPKTYVEIGVFKGDSLGVVRPETISLGVDPDPDMSAPPAPNRRIYTMTSDAFFANHDVRTELGGRAVELAFIDGMHQFEYALRDFMNLEPCCARDGTILVHDVYPLDEITARRERLTEFWSGDIWRLVLALKKYRPDLDVRVIATAPTGLGMIRNLNPDSGVIRASYDRIVREFLGVDFSILEGRQAEMLNLFPNDPERVRSLLGSVKTPFMHA